ncbi:MAG: hypothetical protein LBC80_07400 [Treponema sp.]|jgi:predicted nuclease with TOPRIM domain|nr:hypothetical protein [Treponema sp.]
MISLEQVQLLETKVAKMVEFLQTLSTENTALVLEKAALHDKLEANQKRLDELETLVLRFKEDQGRIEDGIIAALDRLSQFEEAFEKGLKEKTTAKKNPAKKTAEKQTIPAPDTKQEFFEIAETETDQLDDALSDNDSSCEGELDIF